MWDKGPDISGDMFKWPDVVDHKTEKPWAEMLRKPWRAENLDSNVVAAKRNTALYISPKWKFDWMSADLALRKAAKDNDSTATTQSQLDRSKAAKSLL